MTTRANQANQTTHENQTDLSTARRARIRVPLKTPSGIFGRMVTWYYARTFGEVIDPAYVMGHHRAILRATTSFESKVARWHALDPGLKNLAQLAAAGAIGCSWCMDFGTFLAHQQGGSLDKLRQVSLWRGASVFSDLERDVLAYAEAMTATPPEVDDAMVDGLVARLGVPAVVELTKMVAVENERSRFNHAMGLTSQGFSEACELPPPR